MTLTRPWDSDRSAWWATSRLATSDLPHRIDGEGTLWFRESWTFVGAATIAVGLVLAGVPAYCLFLGIGIVPFKFTDILFAAVILTPGLVCMLAGVQRLCYSREVGFRRILGTVTMREQRFGAHHAREYGRGETTVVMQRIRRGGRANWSGHALVVWLSGGSFVVLSFHGKREELDATAKVLREAVGVRTTEADGTLVARLM